MASECSFGEDHCGVVIELESENARLKEALRGCLNSLCEYVDVDSPGKMSDRKGRGQKAAARACEVLGDA